MQSKIIAFPGPKQPEFDPEVGCGWRAIGAHGPVFPPVIELAERRGVQPLGLEIRETPAAPEPAPDSEECPRLQAFLEQLLATPAPKDYVEADRQISRAMLAVSKFSPLGQDVVWPAMHAWIQPRQVVILAALGSSKDMVFDPE